MARLPDTLILAIIADVQANHEMEGLLDV